mgnify:FL=1
MDAKLMKIQISPAKYGNDGELTKYETAQLTFEVPLDSGGQRADIISLLDALKGDVRLTVEKTQYTLGGGKSPLRPDTGLMGIYDPEDELEELAAQGKIRSFP